MDIYGHGQSIGAIITCYCRKNNINIDDLTTEMKKNPSMFISGILDGIGGNRNNGRSANNGILEGLKI